MGRVAVGGASHCVRKAVRAPLAGGMRFGSDAVTETSRRWRGVYADNSIVTICCTCKGGQRLQTAIGLPRHKRPPKAFCPDAKPSPSPIAPGQTTRRHPPPAASFWPEYSLAPTRGVARPVKKTTFRVCNFTHHRLQVVDRFKAKEPCSRCQIASAGLILKIWVGGA